VRAIADPERPKTELKSLRRAVLAAYSRLDVERGVVPELGNQVTGIGFGELADPLGEKILPIVSG
jgi:hypothetical protein